MFVLYCRSCARDTLLNSDSEEKLAAACRNGDKVAYAGLVRACSGCVFAVCLVMLRESHDAEDVAQQALLKGLRNIKQLRDGEQFRAWISQIAKNLCIDFIRKRKREQSALSQVARIKQGGEKKHVELEGALAKLPEECRLVLMLYYFDGRSAESIAETLKISRAAVHTRLSRARKQLRKLLRDKGEI